MYVCSKSPQDDNPLQHRFSTSVTLNSVDFNSHNSRLLPEADILCLKIPDNGKHCCAAYLELQYLVTIGRQIHVLCWHAGSI